MDKDALLKDSRLRLAARFFLLLALPFLLGLYVFPHAQYIDGRLLETPQANQSAAPSFSYNFSSASHSIALQQSVGSVFPLSDYLNVPPLVSQDRTQLCFRDNGSSFILPNGTQVTAPLEWVIHVNSQPPLQLPPDSLACADVPSDMPVSYAWTAEINTGIDAGSLNGTIVFNPQTVTYPRREMDYGLLQGLVMVPVFYLFIWYPLAGIWKKLHKGMMEQ